MNWFAYLLFWVPPIFAGLILVWLFYLTLKGKLSARIAKQSFVLVIIVYFLKIIIQLGYIYFRLRNDEFGKFFLPPENNYFYNLIWETSSPYLIALGIGVFIVLVLWLLKKYFGSEILDRSDFYVLLLTIFVVGLSNIIVLILGSLFLMIFFLIGFNLRQKKLNTEARLVLTPFLLIVSLAILVLGNFNFYLEFLEYFRLT